LLQEMAERGERRVHSERSRGSTEEPLPPTLEDLGVTKKQSHNWQKLASLDSGALAVAVVAVLACPGGATRGTGFPFTGKLECDVAEFTITNRTFGARHCKHSAVAAAS
jgi:hypothetical protein